MENPIKKLSRIKRAKRALEYAKKTALNTEVMALDIDNHLTKMKNEIETANKIKEIPIEIYQPFIMDIEKIQGFVFGGKITKDKGIIKLVQTFDKKHEQAFKMIDERLSK